MPFPFDSGMNWEGGYVGASKSESLGALVRWAQSENGCLQEAGVLPAIGLEAHRVREVLHLTGWAAARPSLRTSVPWSLAPRGARQGCPGPAPCDAAAGGTGSSRVRGPGSESPAAANSSWGSCVIS